MTTNVTPPAFTASGFQSQAESTILAGAFADLQAAFGGNLNPDLSTPQGQLASSIASMIGQTQDGFMFITAMMDPAFSYGRYQDALARIYFLSRLGPLPTAVSVVCTGAVSTFIPAGSLVQATDGTIYASTDNATIGSGGSVTVNFEATVTGPIACAANSVTIIRTAIGGWDSVNNPTAGSPGRDSESRSDFEARRSASVGLNSVGMLPSIRSLVLNVGDVLDAYVTENNTGSTTTIGGVSVTAHSLFVAVLGGSDADVARAVWNKKPVGCGYFGNTTVTVQDTSSGYAIPYPSYTVKFTRPTAVPIYFDVEISSSASVPANAVSLVQSAISSAFVGADGDQREGIGATVFASRYIAAVRNLGAWARVISLKIGTTSSPASDDVALNIDQNPTVTASHIAVNIV